MRKQTRFWIVLLLFGFIGQLAWVIENMYFNVFVYNTITKDVSVIANMVALSAVTATVTTLVMGALSDKLGKRKTLMALGYLFWGFSVIIFAFLKKETVARLFPKASAAVEIRLVLPYTTKVPLSALAFSTSSSCVIAWPASTSAATSARA